MVRVALTGGIATGKSYVRRRLERHGVPTVDADVLARAVVEADTPGAARLRERFGPAIFRSDGSLDRAALGRIVFEDAAARRDVEAIVHPAVYDAIRLWFAGLPPQTTVGVADIPLLFETGREGDFDRVVVVACPADEQVRRLARRDGLTPGEAQARLAAQWPIDEKVRLADDVIWTTGTFAETDAQVDRLVERWSAAQA